MAMNRFDWQLGQRFFKIAKLYWVSEKKWQARGLLAIVLLLSLLVSGLDVAISYIGRDYMTALSNRESGRYFQQLFIYGGIFALATPILVYYRYFKKSLSLHWREWMTDRFLRLYFTHRSYYFLNHQNNIDNPDQRISEDIRSFTTDSVQYLLIISAAVIDLLAFIGILWSISVPLVITVIIYAVIGSIVTIYFGKKLIGLNFHQLRREADFRYGLMHIRDHAESIAFYQGESQEFGHSRQHFRQVVNNYSSLIFQEKNLDFFTTGYSYFVVILPSLIVAPMYFNGQVEFGVVTQAIFAFRQVLNSLSVIVNKFDELSEFAAEVNRLDSFTQALEAANQISWKHPCIDSESSDHIAFKQVTLQIPSSQKILIKDLSVTIKPAQGFLIVGNSGVGKSSLLRGLAGLWNTGTGCIARPDLQEMMFLPQRPYMILGSLRDQLLYPKINLPCDDKILLEVLKAVNLEDLPQRVSGFDIQLDWADILSLGEQQRLAFARLLLLKPRFAILDEATSALDLNNEQHLYQQLQAQAITFISAGHRSSLLRYHQYVLELKGDGSWRLMTTQYYENEVSSLL
jgi:putative ATP-binding cassette transporter